MVIIHNNYIIQQCLQPANCNGSNVQHSSIGVNWLQQWRKIFKARGGYFNNPDTFIWRKFTFLNTCCNCPCATTPGPSPPAFVGDDHYCESGDVGTRDLSVYYLSDPLWDGSGCGNGNGCCAQIGMPWFYRKLPMKTTESFEICNCKDSAHI